MTPRYCLPIIEKDKNAVLTKITEQRASYDFFEVWIDYVDDWDNEFLEKIRDELRERLIIVFRRVHGETIQLALEKRKEIIDLFSDSSSLIDLDIEQQRAELEYVKEKNLSVHVLLSFHNFNETPNDTSLQKILLEMEGYNPTVYKIATFCQNETDALRLLQLVITLQAQQKRCIILGMGEQGKITRIFGTLWGNEMVFAPENSEGSSAPGQLTKEQLETIFKNILA